MPRGQTQSAPPYLPVEAGASFSKLTVRRNAVVLLNICSLHVHFACYIVMLSQRRKHDAHHSGRGWGVGNQPYWRGGRFGNSNERRFDQRGCRRRFSNRASSRGRRPPPWEISRV